MQAGAEEDKKNVGKDNIGSKNTGILNNVLGRFMKQDTKPKPKEIILPKD